MWPLRVYYQDTDAGGVVFHGTYFAFLERARVELLRQSGVDLRQLATEYDRMFVVHAAAIDFLQPARLDDLIEVSARIGQLGYCRVVFEQNVMRGSQLLVRATIATACVSASRLRAAALPRTIRTRLLGAA